eukprot:COSAG01_NODE_27130_length_693_cov_1.483165_1_plen_107_part_10
MLPEQQWSVAYDPALAVGLDRCNIDRVHESELTLDLFSTKYADKRPVVILRDPASNAAAQRMTLKQEMLNRFGGMKVQLATQQGYAFKDKKKVELRTYLAEHMTRPI